ncbi:phospholipase-like protein [Tanacetum coccineum]
MLQKQHKVDDSHYDMPLIYYTEGHSLHFGHPEFALITGLPFGTVNFGLYTFGELKFWNRVFLNKLGLSVTNLDVIGVIEDEKTFQNLCDQDFIRLCLIIALEVIFIGRLLTCPVDDTLFRLVENLEDWNCFPWAEHIWTHLYDEIKNVIENHSDENYFGRKKDRMFRSLSHLKDVIIGGLKIQKLYQKHLVGRKCISLKDLIVVTFFAKVLVRERNKEYGVVCFNEEFSSIEYQEKDKNKVKTDKTRHGIEKSVKSQDQGRELLIGNPNQARKSKNPKSR